MNYQKVEDNPPKTKDRALVCTRCYSTIRDYALIKNGWTFCDLWCQDLFFKAESEQK